jgi:hypothetical protein
MFGYVRYQSFQLLDGGELVTIDCKLPEGPNPHPPAALIGTAMTWGVFPRPPDYSNVREGTPVTVRGVYQRDCKLTDCTLIKLTAPADDKYSGRSVVLSGTVESLSLAPENGPFPTVTLEPPSTDVQTRIVCFFKPTDRADLSKFQAGQRISIRGTCSGRMTHTVRIENCSLVSPDVPSIPTEQFFADYDEDLLPGDPIDRAAPPIPVTATELASAWAVDPKTATGTYYRKRLAVTGVLIGRNGHEKTATFESATDQAFTVKLHMTSSRYAQVPDPDETRTPLTFLCTFSGTSSRNTLRLDGGVWSQPPEDPANLRVTADYFPALVPRRVLTYDRVQYGPTGNTIQRFTVQFTPTQQIRLTPQLAGTFPGKSLFQDPPVRPKWARDLKMAKGGPAEQTLMYRVEAKAIEIGQPAVAASGPQSGVRWEAVLQIGAKRGQSWTVEVPPGSKVIYTVTGFRTDPAHGPVVEVLRIATPNPPSAGPVEESLVTYAKGVGEVARVITQRFPNGTGRLAGETRLVEGDATQLRPPGTK